MSPPIYRWIVVSATRVFVKQGGAVNNFMTIAWCARSPRAAGDASEAVERRLVFRRHDFTEGENGGPVEINLGMLIFDGANGVFIERRPAQDDAWCRAIPIQQTRPIARAIGMKQKSVLSAASVAGQAEEWHVPALAPLLQGRLGLLRRLGRFGLHRGLRLGFHDALGLGGGFCLRGRL